MRDTRRRRAAAVAAAAAVLGTSGLAGCGVLGGDGDGGQRRTLERRQVVVWDRRPDSVAAVGDSITRGFDACSVLSDCPEVSWATGSDPDVDSLAVRLLGRDRASAHSWNYAVSGARMTDLPGQMAKAATRRPKLVAVLAGANDACRTSVSAMTPVDDFRADFERSMRVLRKKTSKAQVYVASVPDLKRLWSEGRANPLGKQIWKLGICPSMLSDSDALDSAARKRRDAVRDRVVAYNAVLKDVCARDRRCRYDGGAVFDYRFGTDQLSHWDWFHPSRDGQARLAEIAYRRVTAKTPAG
ncbi:SGNH/GDSL hydrolase family protein [Streptomyces sp. NPDC058045]|uniref:SGNH/GDSL hydrolase family protein n=1 Tax=Streptomyces sp. NPDC058045 TaxID=3346311 RepID=UPI0036EF8AAD